MLKKIINWYWNLKYPELSDAQVKEFFNLFYTPMQMSEFLQANGFVWASDGLNWSRWTDTFERPGQVLARKFANCGGYMRLFKEFCLYRGYSVAEYELINHGFDYHYSSCVEKDGDFFMQSNLNIHKIADEAHFRSVWIVKYKSVKRISAHGTFLEPEA